MMVDVVLLGSCLVGYALFNFYVAYQTRFARKLLKAGRL